MGKEGDAGAELAARAAALVSAADRQRAGVAVMSAEAAPHFRWLSDGVAELFGYSREELMSISALKLSAKETLGAAETLSSMSADGKALPRLVKLAIERKDGTRLPLEVGLCEARLDGERVTAAVLLDISEPTRIDQSLRQSEQGYRRLVEAIRAPIWINDAERMLYANSAALELLGYRRLEDLLGVEPQTLIAPEDWSQAERRFLSVLAGRSLPSYELRMVTREGESRTLRLNSFAVDHEGERALLCVGRDITEETQAENRLLQADRLATLGMLAGSMAHAINNPLAYVLLNLGRLPERIRDIESSPESRAEVLSHVREARREAERIVAVVKRMRDLSRFDDPRSTVLEMRPLLDAALGVVENEFSYRGRLDKTYERAPKVYGASAKIEQVLISLLLFAVRSLPRDGFDNYLRVFLGSEPRGGARVALQFSALPFDDNRDAQLLGLGICRSLVKSLGGRLEVDERENETTLVLLLPPAPRLTPPPNAPRPSSRAPSEDPAGRRGRVLVIDDNTGVCEALRLMLSDDHDVTAISSARDALEGLISDELHYDVVFCDLMMPELSGMDLYRTVQFNRPGRERCFVFMTGGAYTQEAVSFLGQVPNAHIDKPFDLPTLQRLVWLAVARRR